MIDVEESTFDIFLRYGLFFGAVFQLICIGAAIFGPDSSESNLKVRFIKTNIMYFLFTKINFLNNRRTTVRTRGQNRAAQSILTGPQAIAEEKWRKRNAAKSPNNKKMSRLFHL